MQCQNVASKRHKRDVKRHKRHLKRSKRHKWSLEQTLERAAPTTKGASVVGSYVYAVGTIAGRVSWSWVLVHVVAWVLAHDITAARVSDDE